MTGFLLAFIATLVLGLGARDQMLIAGLAARQGQRPALLLVALASVALSAATMQWLARGFAAELEPAARWMLGVLALGAAALEMIALKPKRPPSEPTASLGAFGLVLLATQLTDAARFLLFAIVVAAVLPGAAALGGALGGMAVIAIGWAAADLLPGLPLARIRRGLGLVLLVLAIGLVFTYK